MDEEKKPRIVTFGQKDNGSCHRSQSRICVLFIGQLLASFLCSADPDSFIHFAMPAPLLRNCGSESKSPSSVVMATSSRSWILSDWLVP